MGSLLSSLPYPIRLAPTTVLARHLHITTKATNLNKPPFSNKDGIAATPHPYPNQQHLATLDKSIYKKTLLLNPTKIISTKREKINRLRQATTSLRYRGSSRYLRRRRPLLPAAGGNRDRSGGWGSVIVTPPEPKPRGQPGNGPEPGHPSDVTATNRVLPRYRCRPELSWFDPIRAVHCNP